MRKRRYYYTWSPLVIGISVVVVTIIAGLVPLEPWVFVLFGITPIAILGGFVPIYAEEREGVLIIRFPLHSKVYRPEEYTFTPMSKLPMKECLRTFGSGGLFGWIGHFSHTKHGDFVLYSTDERKAKLFIRAKAGRQLIITDLPSFYQSPPTLS